MDFRAFADSTNPNVDCFRAIINAQAREANVPPCALAAIIEIESNGQNILQLGMPLGPGCGVGVCQITAGVDWDAELKPTFQGFDLLDPAENVFVAARFFLRPAIDAAIVMRTKNQNWMAEVNAQILFWAFAAYNAGPGFVAGCVRSRENPDTYTTNFYARRALAVYLRNLERSVPAPARG